jgi:hypothetical protein
MWLQRQAATPPLIFQKRDFFTTPDGHGSVSRMNYIRSRDREGAVKGAGDASAFECGKEAIRYFFTNA